MSDTAPSNQAALRYGATPKLKPRPTFEGERLWTLRKGVHELVCGIVYHVEPLGFDVQVFEDRIFLMSHRWGAKEAAVTFADGLRGDFALDGWTANDESESR